MAKKENKHPPKLKEYEESFDTGTITIREVEPDTGKWEVVDFQKMDLQKLSKALLKLLKDKKDCYIILISGVRVSQSYTRDEIFQELANSICEEKLKNIFLS